MKLWIAPGSSSFAPHIALNEIGASFELVPLSFHRKETRKAGYLSLNPAGKVPTLANGDFVLTEVLAILFYLARKFPEAGLMPGSGIAGEARGLSWMSYLASGIHPTFGGPPEDTIAAFAVAEERLAGHEWAVGAHYSIVDIHLFRLFWRAHHTIGLPRETLPGLWAHYERVGKRPAVKATQAAEAALGYELRGLKLPD
ncbi:hypothetical protein GRI89_17390 [Altererythrobacter salegens]|uniref:Glutathione S-transferase n=1 Tax=Croceibacterium salegens TaxID=1737568 RepID=A0A6I4SZ96_9SPHN|nr:glutathione S-transferase family protein [Croceibacterium salegens]MXO61321.1 hypothetical protein [Croceibacterium salegens]